MNRSKFGGLIKKSAAVALSMVMVFGAVSVLPGSVMRNNAIVAHADEEYAANNCAFKFRIVEPEEKESYAIITDVEILNSSGSVVIPSTVTSGGRTYPVTEIGSGILESNKEVKSVVVPDSVKTIRDSFLKNSSVEKVTLTDNIESIGQCFCMECRELKEENFIYNGTKLKEVSSYAFYSSSQMFDQEKGSAVIGNWLVRYVPDQDVTSVKIADLSHNGVKIDHIAEKAILPYNKSVTTIDLEGVKYLGGECFSDWSNLTTILNDDDVEEVSHGVFYGTPWYNEAQKKDIYSIGKVLIYYNTDGKLIDMKSKEFSKIKKVSKDAFKECVNADTIILSSDVELNADAFYVDHDNSGEIKDPLPSTATYKIKNIYVDGKKIGFSKDDPIMDKWVQENWDVLSKTQWFKDNVEAKTKALFEQLDITYYGVNNNKAGTLSPTEEFYIMLKIHEYISTFDVDLDCSEAMKVFMYNGKTQCNGYATLTNYLLQCAGVRFVCNLSLEGVHAWNQVKVGDEWFECDMGWDEQNGKHNYYWFAISSDLVKQRSIEADSISHIRENSSTFWYSAVANNCDDYVPAARTLGDLDGDGKRTDKDSQILWDHIRGNVTGNTINTKAADINFDGVVDITDGVLLENFLNGTAVDPSNYPTDALSPGFNVVFADSYKPESIDPNYFTYDFTDRDGYIVLPESEFKAPEGMKFGGWDYGKKGKVGKVGEKVKISNPYTVIQPIWKDESEPDVDEDKWLLGDVDGNGVIDIGDVSMLINHINGVKALDKDAMLRADVNKSNTVDISDASTIVNHINGVKALEGKV